jgi:SNF2 family DNA or RNA helicase
MGLGKTVELIALILGNPLKDMNGDIDVDGDDSIVKHQLPKSFTNLDGGKKVENINENRGKKAKIITDTKATLIVVPSTLLGQWWRELHNRINKRDKNNMSDDDNSIKSFDILDISDIDFKDFYVPYKVYYMNIHIYKYISIYENVTT